MVLFALHSLAGVFYLAGLVIGGLGVGGGGESALWIYINQILHGLCQDVPYNEIHSDLPDLEEQPGTFMSAV